MAIARTDIGAFSRAGTSSPFVTGSFTPPDNSLLVVAVTCEDCPTGWSTAVAISGGGLTWTKRLAVDSLAVGQDGLAIFTAPVTTGASMTLSITGQGTGTTGLYARAFAFTGYNVGSPIGATASYGAPTSGAVTSMVLTLSAAPAASSVVLGVLGAADIATGIGPGGSGGFTEIFDEQLPAAWQHTQCQVRTGSTSTTVDWIHDSFEQYERNSAALEIKAATGGTPARAWGQVIG